MGFNKVVTFLFQKIPMNLLANKTQVTHLRAPGLRQSHQKTPIKLSKICEHSNIFLVTIKIILQLQTPVVKWTMLHRAKIKYHVFIISLVWVQMNCLKTFPFWHNLRWDASYRFFMKMDFIKTLY